MRLKNGYGLDFKPTKTWMREHAHRPKFCGAEKGECYCVMDWLDSNAQGFCTGLRPIDGLDPDVVHLCINFFDSRDNKLHKGSFAMHLNEALWLSSGINVAVMSAIAAIPEYRKVMNVFGNERTKTLNKSKRTGKNE